MPPQQLAATLRTATITRRLNKGWLRFRAENKDDDAHDGRRIKSLELILLWSVVRKSVRSREFMNR